MKITKISDIAHKCLKILSAHTGESIEATHNELLSFAIVKKFREMNIPLPENSEIENAVTK